MHKFIGNEKLKNQNIFLSVDDLSASFVTFTAQNVKRAVIIDWHSLATSQVYHVIANYRLIDFLVSFQIETTDSHIIANILKQWNEIKRKNIYMQE